MSFGGSVKPEPLKISLSAIEDFLDNWVIPGKPKISRPSWYTDISTESSTVQELFQPIPGVINYRKWGLLTLIPAGLPCFCIQYNDIEVEQQ